MSSFSKSIIIRLTHKVAYNLTRNNENIQGKVDEIIGGQIIELDVIKARQEGEEKGIRAFIEDKLQDGVAVEIIQKKLERRFKLTQEQAKGFIQKYAKIKLRDYSTFTIDSFFELSSAATEDNLV